MWGKCYETASLSPRSTIQQREVTMKFTLTFKDPNGPYETVRHLAHEMAKKDADGRPAKDYVADIFRKLEPWVGFREYISIEFDLELGTAIVVKDG